MQFRVIRYEKIEGPKTGSPARGNGGVRGGGEGTVSKRSIRGAGDLLAMVLQPGARLVDSMFGTALADCDQCKARRQELNELFPLGKR